MSRETKKPSTRGQALNDATEGQFGEQPSPKPNPNIEQKDLTDEKETGRGPKRIPQRKRYVM